MLDPRVQLAHLHPDAQLLAELPGESGALTLLRFHLPAREFPQIGSLADRLAARHQHLVAALDQRRHDEDPALHGRSPRPKSTPALETMNAPPGITSGPPEKPEPGSKTASLFCFTSRITSFRFRLPRV